MDSSEQLPARAFNADAPNNHVHTDSMVTVPLSDIQSNSEHTQPDWRNLDIPQTPVDSTSPEVLEDESEEEIKTTPTRDGAKPEVEQDSGANPTRSRSHDGKGQRKSGDRDVVDWEELDKTEENEPRGEGSDEVRNE